jgi:hypothetical protein
MLSVKLMARVVALVIVAGQLAACSDDPVFEPGTTPSGSYVPDTRPLLTLDWQEQARALVATHRLSTLAAGRIYAALSVAQMRAVYRADQQMAVLANQSPANRVKSHQEIRRGAVAGASARVLSFFFPAAANQIAQRVVDQGQMDGVTHQHFTLGEQLGRAAGDQLVTHVQADGFTTPFTGTVPTGPGMWIPTALPPAGATLGSVKPYFMTTGLQFRPGAPPAFNSPAFTSDVNEIVTMTANRTPAQFAAARHWDSPAGTSTPVGVWDSIAASYVRNQNMDENAAAQVMAATQATIFDALIACWDAKYFYWTLRPSQANSAVSLAFPNPNFPAYPSGHSCVSAAGGRVLSAYFPARSADLANMVEEAGLSRMWAGIHYRFDVTSGQALGRKVADQALVKGVKSLR